MLIHDIPGMLVQSQHCPSVYWDVVLTLFQYPLIFLDVNSEIALSIRFYLWNPFLKHLPDFKSFLLAGQQLHIKG